MKAREFLFSLRVRAPFFFFAPWRLPAPNGRRLLQARPPARAGREPCSQPMHSPPMPPRAFGTCFFLHLKHMAQLPRRPPRGCGRPRWKQTYLPSCLSTDLTRDPLHAHLFQGYRRSSICYRHFISVVYFYPPPPCPMTTLQSEDTFSEVQPDQEVLFLNRKDPCLTTKPLVRGYLFGQNPMSNAPPPVRGQRVPVVRHFLLLGDTYTNYHNIAGNPLVGNVLLRMGWRFSICVFCSWRC